MRKRGLLAILALTAILAFAFLFSGAVTASETDSPRMLYDESGNLIGMQVDPAMARREMSPDMLQSYGEPMEPVHIGQENLKVFSIEDDPMPMEPPFAPDVLVYTSGTADDTPRIAINPTDGWLWVAFTHFNGVDDDVYVMYSDDTGVTWNPALQTVGAFNERNPSIAIAGNTIMIAFEQDNVGSEQHTYFLRSQDGGQNWGAFYMNWDWTNPDPPNTDLRDFLDPDISVVRPQWFHWTSSAWGPNDNTRTVAFMWTETDGDSWSMVYWTFGWHAGVDFERPVIMENSATEYVHNAYMRENLTVGGYDIEWLIVDHALSDIWGWWTPNLDADNTELQPDIAVWDDVVYLVWQNGTADPDLTAFYSDDGAVSSLYVLWITQLDGWDQMYPSVSLNPADFVPHISSVNDTSITYLNNTDVLNQAFSQWKADDFPGWTVADFRATEIIYALNNPRIVFTDARLGAADIWYTDLGLAPEISITITHSPLIAVGDVLVDGMPCSGTCVYQWVLGSTHTLEAPTLMTDPVDPCVRYTYASWSDGGLQTHIYTTPSAAETVTAYYDPQYDITVDTLPITGLEVLVNGTPYSAPVNFWWTLGEVVNLDVTSPQPIDGTSRYAWQSWSDGGGQSHPVTITQCQAYVATFGVQYMVNVTTNPVGLMVEVDAVPLVSPQSFWWLDGSVHDLNAISPQPVSPNERWSFVDWSDAGAQAHQITVVGPMTYTANYITQYNISFTTSPVGLDVEVDGMLYDTGAGPVYFFWDVGSVHTINAPSPQPINPTSRYVWLSWNDMGAQSHQITVTNPATFTANFGVQYEINVMTAPIGLNVTVDAIEYTAPYTFWCSQGSSAMLGAPSPQPQTPTMRYRWNSWSDMGTQTHPIICNMANTYTANFVAQYLLNVSTDPQGLDVGVDGITLPAPRLSWYDTGAVVTINAPSPQLSGNMQSVYSHWNDGQPQTHQITVTGPATYIAYYDTQWMMTVTSSPVTGLDVEVNGIPQVTEYQFWCNDGELVNINAVSPQDLVPGSSRYVWQSWSDGLGKSHTVTCNGPNTYTANFGLEYFITVTTNPAGRQLEIDGVPAGSPFTAWWADGSVHSIGTPSPQDQIPGSSQYVFTIWSDAGAQYHDITVTGANTYVANFKVQYKITITTAPVVGLEVIADGVPQTSPYVVWLDSGMSYALDVTSPQIVVAGERWVFSSWSDSQPKSHNIVVAQAQTYTATMSHEFEVTIASAPVGGISITVDGSGYTTPQSFWWLEGSSHSISGVDFQNFGAGARYAFASWSDMGARTHNIVADMAKTLTATYTTQYYLTVTSAYGSPTGENWYDSGATATFSVTSPEPGVTGVQYVFTAWTGDSTATTPSAQIVMDAPKTVTATWTTQYYLTVDSPQGTATGEGWYDSGTTAYAGVDVQNVTVGSTRYLFAQWTGDASGTNYAQSAAITMNAPKTATAQWTTQYLLTVNSAYGDPTGQGWYDSGTSAAFSVTTPYAGATGTQYLFSAWSGDSSAATPSASVTMNAPKTVTAVWITQYQLTVTSTYGNPQGAGWKNSGSTAAFSVTSPSAGTTGTRYMFSAWSGDSTANTASASVLMDGPKTVTAGWTTQYYLTVQTDHGTVTGEGWHDAGTQATISVTSPVTEDGTEWAFTGWSGDSTSSSKTAQVLMDNPKTVVAKWEESGFLAKYWWIFPVIIVIIIVVILAIWMMKRKKPGEEELPPPEEMEIPPEEEV